MLDVAPPWTASTPDRTDSHVAGPLDWTAAGLLFAAAVVGVVSLFPAYYKGQGSLDTYAEQVVPAATVIAGWLVAGMLVSSRRGALVAAGAWGAVGIAVSEAGLRLADFGELSAGARAGEGLWLFTAAWAAASVGAVLAVAATRRAGSGGRPVRPGPASEIDRTVGVVATGVGILAAVAFIPSWDRYLATSSVDPTFFLDVTLGDAFKNPGVTIAGNVVTAVSFALVPLVAVLWRPMRVGGALLAGTLVVLAGQVVSATAQVLEKPDPFQVFTATQYAELRPTVTLHLTGWFDTELAALLVLLLVAASRLHHHQEATPGGGGTGMVPYSWPPAPAGPLSDGAPAGAWWGGAPVGSAPVGSAPRVGAGWGGAAPQGVGPGGVGPAGGAAAGGQWGGPGGGAAPGGQWGGPGGMTPNGGAWGGGADPARPSPPRPAPPLPPWPERGDAPRAGASHAPAAPPPVAPEQAEMVDVPTAGPARPAAEAAVAGPAPVPPAAPPASPVAQAAPPDSVTSSPESGTTALPEPAEPVADGGGPGGGGAGGSSGAPTDASTRPAPPSWGDVPPPMWHERDDDGGPT